MKRFFALLGLLALFACQTTQKRGQGPLHIQDELARTIEYYVNFPFWFNHIAVSPDGEAYMIGYCSSASASDCRMPSYEIARSCNTKHNREDCKVLFDDKDIVWDTPGDFMPYYSPIIENALGYSYYKKGSNPHEREKPLKPNFTGEKIPRFYWGNSGLAVASTVYLNARSQSGKITIPTVSSKVKNCIGKLNYDEIGSGDWEIKCSSNLTASGKLSYYAGAELIVGKGWMSDGQPIKFHLRTHHEN